jgi:hypothetical protein
MDVGIGRSLAGEERLQVHSLEHRIWKEDLRCEKLRRFSVFLEHL